MYSIAHLRIIIPKIFFKKHKNICLPYFNTYTAKVLELHYYEGHSLKAITLILKRLLTVIYNHYNRGIFKLHKYFNP